MAFWLSQFLATTFHVINHGSVIINIIGNVTGKSSNIEGKTKEKKAMCGKMQGLSSVSSVWLLVSDQRVPIYVAPSQHHLTKWEKC